MGSEEQYEAERIALLACHFKPIGHAPRISWELKAAHVRQFVSLGFCAHCSAHLAMTLPVTIWFQACF